MRTPLLPKALIAAALLALPLPAAAGDLQPPSGPYFNDNGPYGSLYQFNLAYTGVYGALTNLSVRTPGRYNEPTAGSYTGLSWWATPQKTVWGFEVDAGVTDFPPYDASAIDVSLRGRYGMVVPQLPAVLYVAAGPAVAYFTQSTTKHSLTALGGEAAVGLDYKINNNLIARVEVSYDCFADNIRAVQTKLGIATAF